MTLKDYLKEAGRGAARKLAKLVKVSPQTISNLANGSTPSAPLAFAIQRATNEMVKADEWVRR